MRPELKGEALRLLAAVAALAAAAYAGRWFSPLKTVVLFASFALLCVVGFRLISLFKRMAEPNIAQLPSQLLRGASWLVFCAVAVPLAMWIAFMACCAPLMYFS